MGEGVGAGEGDAGAAFEAFFPKICSKASVSFICRSLALKATSDDRLWPNQALMASRVIMALPVSIAPIACTRC